MDEGFEAPLSVDKDGFLSQGCPQCKRRFKVSLESLATDKQLSYCPYCGHKGQGCWWTPEQAEFLGQEVMKPVAEELRKMAKEFDRKPGSCGLVNMKAIVTGSNTPTNTAMRCPTGWRSLTKLWRPCRGRSRRWRSTAPPLISRSAKT